MDSDATLRRVAVAAWLFFTAPVGAYHAARCAALIPKGLRRRRNRGLLRATNLRDISLRRIPTSRPFQNKVKVSPARTAFARTDLLTNERERRLNFEVLPVFQPHSHRDLSIALFTLLEGLLVRVVSSDIRSFGHSQRFLCDSESA